MVAKPQSFLVVDLEGPLATGEEARASVGKRGRPRRGRSGLISSSYDGEGGIGDRDVLSCVDDEHGRATLRACVDALDRLVGRRGRNADRAEPLADPRPDGGGVLADAAREHECVETIERRHGGGDASRRATHEQLDRQGGTMSSPSDSKASSRRISSVPPTPSSRTRPRAPARCRQGEPRAEEPEDDPDRSSRPASPSSGPRWRQPHRRIDGATVRDGRHEPPPRCATTSRNALGGRPSITPAERTDHATDSPWKPYRRTPWSVTHWSGTG